MTMKQATDASLSMQGEFALPPAVRVRHLSWNRPWQWKCSGYINLRRCVQDCTKCCWVRYCYLKEELCQYKCHTCRPGTGRSH